MASVDSTVVNVALPALQASFHATLVDVQWVVESYGLFLAALILVGGSLGDLLGRRLIFLLGATIFAVASAGCGFSANIHQLILARSIQGLGAALLVPGSLAIISTSFDENSRGRVIGTWSGFTAITTAIGPVLGGWLIEHASWRWAFLINLPLAAAVIAISVWRIPESRVAGAGNVDWLGAVLATVGVGGLVSGFVESAVGIFFFVFPLNLIQVQGYSTTATGAAILPLILLMFLLSRWSGGLVARYGPRDPLVIGPVVAAFGFVSFALPSIGESYWKAFFPAIVVLGLGLAVTVAPLTTVVMNSVDQERVGAASGINNAVARLAGVLAIAVLGLIMVKAFDSRLNQRLAGFSLPPEIRQELQQNESKLAGLQVPAGLAPDTEAAVRQSIQGAFVFGFRILMLICAGLSLASAAVARLMISKDREPGIKIIRPAPAQSLSR
jgi:MFS family permease